MTHKTQTKFSSYFLLAMILMTLFTSSYGKSFRGGGIYHYVNTNSGRTHYVGMTNNFNRRNNERCKLKPT